MASPYFDYKKSEKNKDGVEYDYELKVIQPMELECDDYPNPNDIPEGQMIDVCESIENGIDELNSNEDYVKESFEELGLGRVYISCNEAGPNDIEMYFGISLIDKEQEVNLDILKDDIKEYMNVLDSNTEYDSYVTGWESYGGTPADDEIVEPTSIFFKCKGEPKIEVIKQPNKKENKMEEKEIENVVKDIDKTLINEGTITFKKNNDKQQIVEVKMNDDGVIEIYKENKLINTLPFAKLSLIRECKTILQKGYLLETTLTNKDGETIDTEKEKERIEQATQEIDEIQKMKDELQDKVNTLMGERKTLKTEMPTKIPEFPSTDFTKRKLTANEIADIDLINNLTQEQKNYIDTYLCNSNEGSFQNTEELEWYLRNDYANYFFPDLANEPITSIDDYINGIFTIRKEKEND